MELYSEAFSDHLVQISKLFWLAAVDLGDPTTEFKEFIEEHTKEELAKIFEEDAFLSIEDEDDDERYLEQVATLLYNNKRLRYGFLAVLAIPMRSNFAEHSCTIHGGIMITDVTLELPLDVFKKFDIFPIPSRAYQGTPERKARYQKIGMLIIMGYGSRTIAAATGVSKTTVRKIKTHMNTQGLATDVCKCLCGGEIGHQGWCRDRFKRSKLRQQMMSRLKKSK